MVGVIVGQHDRIEPAYPLAGERRSQDLRIGPGVYQDRARGVFHEDRVALTDIEHSHARLPLPRGPHG